MKNNRKKSVGRREKPGHDKGAPKWKPNRDNDRKERFKKDNVRRDRPGTGGRAYPGSRPEGRHEGKEAPWRKERRSASPGHGAKESSPKWQNKKLQRPGEGQRFTRSGNNKRSFQPRRAKFSPGPEADKSIRLNKYIANTGICSRREADELIAAGVVTVNGQVITQMGFKVQPGDVVRYNDQAIKPERPVYVLLNKPKDYITTSDDPQERKTVMELVRNACRERIYPVGRLDRATTGLLLFTNDGELTRKLTHPSSNVRKIYHVTLDRNVKQPDMDKIAEGVELEDGKAFVDAISYVGDSRSEVGVELHSGRNRVVRRIFEGLGYKVVKLDRVYFAGLTKKDLSRGRWRFLTEMEVNMLKMISSGKGSQRRTKKDKREAD